MDRSYYNLSTKMANSPRRRLSLVQTLKKTGSGVSVSGRSNQSVQLICRTPNHSVEKFGSSLPVLVTESLTFADRNTVVSVNVSQDGWTWLVCGRKLLVWQCKTTIHDPKQKRTTFMNQCRELQLPQSDLAHKASCIAVWLQPGQQVPSCMAVSPEGTVRYWASIANEESSVETSAELTGQEVDCLTCIPGHGCVLATTTCTVALLQIQSTGGRNIITTRVLKNNKNWLGGIGRRMSSLIFGSIPQSPVLETKLVKVICTEINEKGSRVLILAGNSLQYWYFPQDDQEKMEFDEDIGQLVTQAFVKKFWENGACNPQNINTWLIDMQPVDDGLVLLMAAHAPDFSPQVHFSLGSIHLRGTSLKNQFSWFIPIKLGSFYHKDEVESLILSYRFILAGWEIIVFNEQNVLVVSNQSEYEQDKIDLTRGGEDSILGGSLCSGTPVLFTRNHGLVTITSDFAAQDFNTSYSDVNASMDYTVNGNAGSENFSTMMTNEDVNEMFFSSDGATQLRAAFTLSLRHNKTQADEILMDLFPPEEEPVMDIDASLDTLVLKVAKDLVDDYPANDPRWANHRDLNMTLNSVLAIKIPNQLEGKQNAINLYTSFLIEHGIWDRFCAVTYRGVIMSTAHVLGEIAEKVVAMLAIYNLLQKYSDLIDEAIEKTLPADAYISKELSSRDIFFREVSAVHLLLPNLVQLAVDQTQSERPTQQLAQYISQVNSIILTVLHEVVKYRQLNHQKFMQPRVCIAMEYLPWTAATGEQGLRMCLTTMQNVTLQHGVTNTNDISLRNELFEQLVGLIDLILDGRKCHLESVRKTEKFDALLKQYELERANMIQPLIRAEQYESAAMLAEKYCDFAALIQICELTNNQNRLDGYSERFAGLDFADYLFSWHIKNGRQGQLIERCRRGGADGLTEKLIEHPTLAWIQAALANDFGTAADTLLPLAMQETDLCVRKKSMLSLAKLAYLASDENEEKIEDKVKKIDCELMLIAHQEDVPTHILEMYGYDVDKLRVLSPSELINLYTCLDSPISSEYDFKKALDLLDYIEDEDERSSLKLKIWARAAKCHGNKWETVGKNPEQQIQETLFFKLMDLVHLMGSKIEEALPPVDMILMEPEIGNLSSAKNFQYLIKLIYEYAYNNYAS